MIAKDLKGADYDKKLVWRTEEGLAVRPYYRKEDLAGLEDQLSVRRTRCGWETVAESKPSVDAIRADLLHEAGAHAIQELGYAIAAGVELLAARSASQPVDAAAREIEFVMASAELFHGDREVARRASFMGTGRRCVRIERRPILRHALARAHATTEQEPL